MVACLHPVGGQVMTEPNLPRDSAAERAVLGACMESTEAFRTAAAIVNERDFYEPRHATIWAAISYWVELGAQADPTLVLERVRESGQLTALGGGVSGGAYLAEVYASAPVSLQIRYHAEIVADVATRRRVVEAGQRMIQRASGGVGDVGDLLERAAEDVRSARDERQGVELLTRSVADFMEQAPDRPEWVVPGLFAKGDRVVLTGPGGLGKSTLAVQCMVLAAAGIPPLDWHTNDPVEPARAMIVDCENPDHRVKTRIWPLLKECADLGQPVEDRLTLGGRGNSLNLLDQASAMSLLRTVEHDNPGLIYIGPFYKLHNDDPDKEIVVKKITHVLDQMREISGAALIMEAHHNKAGHAGGSLAPSGSNMWNWWPELGFGLRLDPDSDETVRRCALERWRIDRDAFDWPRWIEHGGRFPWARSAPNDFYGRAVA
jgi:hypothetical protein